MALSEPKQNGVLMAYSPARITAWRGAVVPALPRPPVAKGNLASGFPAMPCYGSSRQAMQDENNNKKAWRPAIFPREPHC
ncbi:hypothetical protein MDA_GLEAN10013430 [Myotis davidii]|uniref:Uncharacterized protein n=1 Tax=Myotis davidii TaxID=225400 RepID=L5M0U6_MYODS|nr:hypothetical protein MDA_GLEAN10013430 [Myotis davidii]